LPRYIGETGGASSRRATIRTLEAKVANLPMLSHSAWLKERFRFRFPWGILGLLVLASLAAAPPAHAQAASEYGGAAGVSAGAASSRPGLFRPGRPGKPNSSRFLAKPAGRTPQQINREWFAKQAGKKGAKLTIDVTPPKSSVWIDGKFVGEAPLTLTLPAGKHHVSLLGPRQQHGKREIDISNGKNQRIDVRLPAVYPSAVSIRVFGQPH
jgi:hypothetical protein